MTKRIIDLILSLCALLLLSPIVTILAVIIRLNIGSPVLFTQNRPGKNGELFKFLKFRTMTDETNEQGVLLSDDQRGTRVGRILRQTSLDELPSFINVLRGDMSLVGPRPLLNEYLPLYSLKEARRHDVKPGITGWAQINGRNAISWEEKFELDVWYVNNQSIYLDIKIMFLTVSKVLKREGINSSSTTTMEKFKGSQ